MAEFMFPCAETFEGQKQFFIDTRDLPETGETPPPSPSLSAAAPESSPRLEPVGAGREEATSKTEEADKENVPPPRGKKRRVVLDSDDEDEVMEEKKAKEKEEEVAARRKMPLKSKK